MLAIADALDVVGPPRVPLSRDQCNPKQAEEVVRSACGPLLEFLPCGRVGVVHHSLAEFLTGNHDKPSYILEAGASHMGLAMACLRYLEDKVLGRTHTWSEADGKANAFAIYAGTNWFVHVGRATAAGHLDQSELFNVLDRLFASVESLEQILIWACGGPGPMHAHLLAYDDPGATQPTPVYAATALRLRLYLEVLLSRKAQVNKGTNRYESPLYIAAEEGDANIAQILLRAGADPEEDDSRQFSGLTPLHCSVFRNDVEMARILLEASANPMTVTQFRDPFSHGHRDKSPLEWVCTRDGHLPSLLAVFLP